MKVEGLSILNDLRDAIAAFREKDAAVVEAESKHTTSTWVNFGHTFTWDDAEPTTEEAFKGKMLKAKEARLELVLTACQAARQATLFQVQVLTDEVARIAERRNIDSTDLLTFAQSGKLKDADAAEVLLRRLSAKLLNEPVASDGNDDAASITSPAVPVAANTIATHHGFVRRAAQSAYALTNHQVIGGLVLAAILGLFALRGCSRDAGAGAAASNQTATTQKAANQ